MDNLIKALGDLTNISNLLTDKVQDAAESSSIQINSVLSRLITLENQVETLQFADANTASSSEELNQPDSDLVVEISEPVSGMTAILAKDVNVKELSSSDGQVKITATGDVSVKNLTTEGDLPKTTAHAQFIVNTDEYVKITESTINQTGYNAIEIGLNSLPKSVIIDGIDFNSTLSNNAILVFGTQDGGTVTVSNCNFAKCSNPIRISNKGNGKVTLNVINCTFTEWDSDPTWAGMIICQDYTSKSAEAEATNNLFAPEKVTVNIVNCTKNGKKITMTSPEDVCGTGNADTQLLYVWNSYEETVPYSADRYPTLTIK